MFANSDRWRSEIGAILEDCLSAMSSTMGAVILKKGSGRLFPTLTRGLPRPADLFRMVKARDADEIWARFMGHEYHTAGVSGKSLLHFIIRVKRKQTGILLLLKKTGHSFSSSDKKIGQAFSRIISRYLGTLDDLDRLQQNYFNTILVLQRTMEAKDHFSKDHSSRVAQYCQRAGETFGLSKKEKDTLYWAAILHDIGKIGIVDAILNKQAHLSTDEMAIVKEHSIIGQRIVQDLSALKRVSVLIRAHHERYDGKGYPDGLSRDEIPFLARILALAETFDTITSCTPYRIGQLPEIAAKELRGEKGRQFDPKLVDPFLEAILF